MIGVIDSQICNIFSLTNMLKKLGAEFTIINKEDQFRNADKLILPGVGAFPKAIENLNKFKFIEPVKDFVKSGKYLMGICLGMHLLFDESDEFTKTKGLEFIPGKINKINTHGGVYKYAKFI